MIRDATADDIPAVMVMGKAFADEAGVTEKVGWDDASVEALLRHMIDSPDGILLVSDNGMIGGLVFAHPFSRQRVFQEFFWRSHGFEGVKLLKTAEAKAKGLGAVRSIMGAMDDLPGLDRLFGRMGYAPTERLYSKEL